MMIDISRAKKGFEVNDGSRKEFKVVDRSAFIRDDMENWKRVSVKARYFQHEIHTKLSSSKEISKENLPKFLKTEIKSRMLRGTDEHSTCATGGLLAYAKI